jgi:hypothetical protein
MNFKGWKRPTLVDAGGAWATRPETGIVQPASVYL